MRILVNHLTRMSPGYICVAGLDEATEQHIRPVLQVGRLPRTMLASEGGPMGIGGVVDLGEVIARPVPPEVEDNVFGSPAAQLIGIADSTHYWQRIEAVARGRLRDIFGDALEVRGSTPSGALPRGVGQRSLGSYQLAVGGELILRERSNKWDLRLVLEDPDLGPMAPPVTDLRLWQADQTTPQTNRIERIQQLLEGAIISVGLSRPFQPRGYDREYHWLQVNNIHPAADPLWAAE